MKTIGERIKERREQLQLSQEELALKLGYKSRSTINKIEMDSRNLKQSKIKAIADALETTPSYIMGWEDPVVEEKEKDSPPDFSFYYDLSEESQAKLKEFAQFLLAQQNKE